MKLKRDQQPRQLRSVDVVKRESQSTELPIPWEAMQQDVKPLLVEWFDQRAGVPSFMDISIIDGILLLFPELRNRLNITPDQFKVLTTFGDPKETDYFFEILHLIRVFPEQRQWIIDSLDDVLQKAERRLQTAVVSEPPDFSELAIVLGLVPQYLKQYQPVLQQGKDFLLKKLKGDLWRYESNEMFNLLGRMADLTLFFPDLRADIQRLAVERRSDILNGFERCKEVDKDGKAAVNSLAWTLVYLKIIYAESAGFREDGTIFIEEKKHTSPPSTPLPSRDLAA